MKRSVVAVLLLAVAGVQLASGESYRAASQQYPIQLQRPFSAPQRSRAAACGLQLN
jgi:hypothetical protein